MTDQPLIEIKNLSVIFRGNSGEIPALRGVDLVLEAGSTLALVGESGSGKSVTCLALMGLLPTKATTIRADKLCFEGRDLTKLRARDWRGVRGKGMAMVFQDPMTSLNPLMRCGEQVAEGIRLHQGLGRTEASLKARDSLARMGIQDPDRVSKSFPFELSGGMRQRVLIASALACGPKLLIADEPTTALDVTVQAQILKLLKELQADLGMALLLVTHDLGIVRDVVKNVQVFYAGSVVERGEVQKVLAQPRHPYTLGLLKSIPPLNRRLSHLESIDGVVPRPQENVPGCRFHPRCFLAKEKCRIETPSLKSQGTSEAACHFSADVPGPTLAEAKA